MSREALKLALEALEYIHEGANNQGPHTGISWRCVSKKAAPVITALRQALANEALDKMADNARELGLDYEPSAGTQVSKVWWDGENLMEKQVPLEDFYKPAQQGPVAHCEGGPEFCSVCHKELNPSPAIYPEEAYEMGLEKIAYYTSPQREWVDLTVEEIQDCCATTLTPFGLQQARALLDKFKEKNT